MSDFRERLKQELKADVPFTKEMKQRILQNEPSKKKRTLWPIFTGGIVAVVAVVLFFLIQTSENTKLLYLYNAAEVSTDFHEMLALLKQNEVKVPLLAEVGQDQKLVTDADIRFNGQLDVFNAHHVVVEQAKNLKRGDYVLVELEKGYKVVSQLIGFEGETYKLEKGNVFINDKQLILPGFINGDIYKKEGNYRDIFRYFEPMHNEYHYLKDVEETLAKDEFLIKGINFSKELFNTIASEQVMGKVVGVLESTPNFMVTGEAAIIYEDLKKNLDTSKLVGLDPATMLRMVKQAEMEREYEVVQALMPTTVNIHNYDLVDIKEYVEWNYENITERERQSIYASLFNGLAEAEFEIVLPKTSAEVLFYIGDESNEFFTRFPMYYNEQGFWEVKFG